MRLVSINPIIECGQCPDRWYYKLARESFSGISRLSAVLVLSARKQREAKMSCAMFRLTIVVVCVIVVLLSLADVTEANYKNAPMNGIMFGKRGPTDYESRGKTFTALCEIATEACQAWFPSQDNK